MARAKNEKGSGRGNSLSNPRQFPSYRAKTEKEGPLVSFLKRFSNWKSWVEGELPAYSLPDELIHLLGPAEGRPKCLLTKEEVEAELEFGKLCPAWNKFCVGVWRRKPVCHYAISDFMPDAHQQTISENQEPESSALTPEQMAENNDRLFGLHACDFVGRAKMFGYWGSAGIPSDCTEEKDFRHAARSCIGSLLCDSSFVNDIQSLCLLWTKLPANLQVPIGDPLTDRDKRVLVAENKSHDVALACVNFSIEHQRVLERWALAGFATWDLPRIQPPLLGVSLFQAAEILPPTARVIYWPPHVQRPPTIDFNSILKSLQQEEGDFRQYAEESPGQPMFPSVPGRQKGGKPSDNEKIAQMVLWEKALQQRYSGRRGSSTRFGEVVQDYFALSTPQGVKNLRGSYRHLFQKRTKATIRTKW